MIARFKSVDKITEESQHAFQFDYFFGMNENHVIRFVTRCQNRRLQCVNVHESSTSHIRSCQIIEDDSSYFWPFWFFEEIEENDDEN